MRLIHFFLALVIVGCSANCRSAAVPAASLTAASDLLVSFPGKSFNKDEKVLATVVASGAVLIESDLKSSSFQETINGTKDVNIGSASKPGSFALHIQSGTQHFVAWLLLLPNGNRFDLLVFDLRTQAKPQPFSSTDVMTKFMNGVTKDNLAQAVKNAAVKFPQEYAVSIGATVTICLVTVAVTSVGVVEPRFCVASLSKTAIDFVLKVNDELIALEEKEGKLTPQEATLLKALWGTTTGLFDVVKLVESPTNVTQMLSAVNSTVQVITTDQTTQFGARAADSLVNKGVVFYEFLKKIP